MNFGRLTAKEIVRHDPKKGAIWRCECECGGEKEVPAAYLLNKKTQSCGCLAEKHITELNRQDITNERFDRLVAIRPTDHRDASGSVIWECKCDCETIVYYSVNMLRQGRVHSCGCLYNETRQDCVMARKDIADHTSISSLVASKKLMKSNTSGYTGVYFDKLSERWNAYIN